MEIGTNMPIYAFSAPLPAFLVLVIFCPTPLLATHSCNVSLIVQMCGESFHENGLTNSHLVLPRHNRFLSAVYGFILT